jgi:hypothetical protein
MARHFGELWFNYEPYQHLTRKGIVNYRGVNHDLQSKKVMGRADELSVSHSRFLKDLVGHKVPTITKFIRGNGRISQVNNCMKPDLTILVVRNIYQVLASVIQMPWNLYSFGSPSIKLSYRNFLDEVVEEALEQGLINESVLKSASFLIGNRLFDNALYWYIMNLSALNSIDDNTLVLRYEEMDNLPELLHSRMPIIFPGDDNMNEKLFVGGNIHSDVTLKSLDTKTIMHKAVGVGNELLYSALNRTLSGGSLSVAMETGEKVVLNSNIDSVTTSKAFKSKMRITIAPHFVIDELQKNVDRLVGAKM